MTKNKRSIARNLWFQHPHFFLAFRMLCFVPWPRKSTPAHVPFTHPTIRTPCLRWRRILTWFKSIISVSSHNLVHRIQSMSKNVQHKHTLRSHIPSSFYLLSSRTLNGTKVRCQCLSIILLKHDHCDKMHTSKHSLSRIPQFSPGIWSQYRGCACRHPVYFRGAFRLHMFYSVACATITRDPR